MAQTEPAFELPGTFSLVIARHATPDRSGFALPYHIPPGPGLTEKGQHEAVELGEYLCTLGTAHVLASPLERAWRTGCIASGVAGATVELNADLAEHRPEESDQEVLRRVQRAFFLGARLGTEHGNVALISHGSPVLILLNWLGLSAEITERNRIYDDRNLIPPAGAWEVRREAGQLNLRLAFVPEGVRRPAGKGEWVSE